jgi:hypothetical protein
VIFSGAEHAVVALSGSSVRLLAASGETTLVAMPYLLAVPHFAVVGTGPLARLSPLGLLESLPAKVAEAAQAWERHLIEVETGLPPDVARRPARDRGRNMTRWRARWQRSLSVRSRTPAVASVGACSLASRWRPADGR